MQLKLGMMGGKATTAVTVGTTINSPSENDNAKAKKEKLTMHKESFRNKLLLLYCGFSDSGSVLQRLPKDIFRYLVVLTRHMEKWDQNRSHNVTIESEECFKPDALASFVWNSYSVCSRPNPTLSSVQLINLMNPSEYNSTCIMIGLSEEAYISKEKVNLYGEGGYYEMFWQFKVSLFSSSYL